MSIRVETSQTAFGRAFVVKYGDEWVAIHGRAKAIFNDGMPTLVICLTATEPGQKPAPDVIWTEAPLHWVVDSFTSLIVDVPFKSGMVNVDVEENPDATDLTLRWWDTITIGVMLSVGDAAHFWQADCAIPAEHLEALRAATYQLAKAGALAAGRDEPTNW